MTVEDVRQQVVVSMLSEYPELRKFVQAFLQVYGETGDVHVSG